VNPPPVQPYDVLMLAVILVTTFLGARKGMAWQVAALAALVVSAFVAVRFSTIVAPYLSSDPQWNRYIAMLVLYLGTSLGIWLAFRAVSGFIDRVKLQGLDHQIGGLFGFAKGVLLCLVITFFAVTLSEWARQNILTSKSGHYITLLLQRGTPLLPDEVRGVLGNYIDELEAKLAADGPPSPDLSPSTVQNLTPGSTLPDLIKRELSPGANSPTIPPASPSANPATRPTAPVSPAPRGPSPPPRRTVDSTPPPAAPVASPASPVASPVSMPRDAQFPVYDPPASQPPSIPPQAFQPPAYPPNYPLSVAPSQPYAYPDYSDEPVPKGMQRVP
jgi:membrane protein required for colicin V production